jgi:hypothetical protein
MKSCAKSGYLFLEGQNVGLKERLSKLKSSSTSTKNTASDYERGASGERSVALHIAPTEDDSRNLKRILAKTLVLVSFNCVVIRIKMPREVARTTCMAPRRWALGQKISKPACSNFLQKKIFTKRCQAARR